MPIIDPLTYIKAALAKDYAEQYQRQRKASQQQDALVITLSRDYGALGEALAQSLAEALGIPVYDREILEHAAKSAKADPHYFLAHDEQTTGGLSGFLYSLVSGNPATLLEYRRHLGEALAGFARQDCILIGRGAHLALAGKKLFRIRVVGSKAVCAQRVAAELDIPLAEAGRKVTETNHKRHKAVVDMYGDLIGRCSLDHADLFDLVINTDHIAIDTARDLVLLALRQSGWLAGRGKT